MKMKRSLLAFLALILPALAAACASSQVLSGVEYTCASATALVELASEYKAKMSDAQKATVTSAVAAINPVCSQATVPTLDSTAHAALSGALSRLTGAVQAAQQ